MYLKLILEKLSKVMGILYIKVKWHFCNNKIHPYIYKNSLHFVCDITLDNYFHIYNMKI